MKDRIKQIIELEGLTQTKFADIIGVQRSNISHILYGRNNPSVEFLQKVKQIFKNINSEWLLMGEGPMYKTPPSTLFNENNDTNKSYENNHVEKEEPIEHKTEKNNEQINNNLNDIYKNNTNSNNNKPINNPVKDNITNVTPFPGNPDQIIVLFDDSTFTTYRKR